MAMGWHLFTRRQRCGVGRAAGFELLRGDLAIDSLGERTMRHACVVDDKYFQFRTNHGGLIVRIALYSEFRPQERRRRALAGSRIRSAPRKVDPPSWLNAVCRCCCVTLPDPLERQLPRHASGTACEMAETTALPWPLAHCFSC